ncbi:class I SAM-dependent methyltransferase, partial [Candidatus Poribacteria bacterium]|nr:class I SAM-dependent methyltransferase [Candidatus Poribacteria bacterium]
YEHILRLYTTPRPFGAILHDFRSNDYPSDEWATLTNRMRLLRDTGMLVRDGDEEPPDCHAVFKAALFLFGIWQLEEEFAPALEAVAELQPRAVVEIGTGWGGSLFSLAQVADPTAHLVSVDIPGGIGGGGYTRAYAPRFRQFCFPDQQLTCVLDDSTRPEVVAHVRESLADRPVDVLFLDGAHSYAGVSADFDNYAPMVRPGGCVLFHDIAHPEGEEPSELMQVTRFWDEVKAGHDYEEFVRDDPDGYRIGVGLLRV